MVRDLRVKDVRPIRVDEGTATAFHIDVLSRLTEAALPFLIGGTFAYSRYSGVDRATKDLDLFVREADAPRVLARLAAAGYRTEVPFPHWLGKIHDGDHLIDVIFSSGNGLARVDDIWFRHAIPDRILDIPVLLCPPEEMIWSKAFVQERERFDGADVLHLIRALGQNLDWPRLVMRFGKHWRVLFSCIVLFGYAYPADVSSVPEWVTKELLRRFGAEDRDVTTPVCRGTLLSRSQYQWDIERLGYIDARLEPAGPLTREEIAIWDAGIDDTA